MMDTRDTFWRRGEGRVNAERAMEMCVRGHEGADPASSEVLTVSFTSV